MTRLWPKGEPVTTWGGTETPDGFVWKQRRHPIAEVCNRWRVHTNWWGPTPEPGSVPTSEAGEAIWREYVKVTTHSGLLCLLYHDLLGGGWYLARVYD
ncbi:MAG: DUF6504 family protein [Anaerolineae bacterium]|jgi:hypothetical protein